MCVFDNIQSEFAGIKFRLSQAANSVYDMQHFKAGWFSRFFYHMLLSLERPFFSPLFSKQREHKTNILHLVTASQNFMFCCAKMAVAFSHIPMAVNK